MVLRHRDPEQPVFSLVVRPHCEGVQSAVGIDVPMRGVQARVRPRAPEGQRAALFDIRGQRHPGARWHILHPKPVVGKTPARRGGVQAGTGIEPEPLAAGTSARTGIALEAGGAIGFDPRAHGIDHMVRNNARHRKRCVHDDLLIVCVVHRDVYARGNAVIAAPCGPVGDGGGAGALLVHKVIIHR